MSALCREWATNEDTNRGRLTREFILARATPAMKATR
jgi:hypothetical protein